MHGTFVKVILSKMSKSNDVMAVYKLIFWFDSDKQQTLEATNFTFGLCPPIKLPTHYA
jgi:hypothetical protein